MTHIGVLPLDVLDALSLHLNEKTTSGTQLLQLPHPRTGVLSLFLPHTTNDAQTSKILEVQSVAPTNARSWFLGDSEVVADGKLLVMTPVDPVFLLIPILQADLPTDGSPGTFRPADDIFDAAATKLSTIGFKNKDSVAAKMLEKDIKHLLSLESVKSALKRACDVKEITIEITVYRFSMPRLVEYLRVKVARLATTDMIESSRTLIRSLAKDGLMEDGKDALLESGRVKAACDLISQYIPPNAYAALLASYDFTKLNTYLQSLQEETALAIANTNTSKAKKDNPKAEDDKKRKGNSKTSQGVDKLKKANINGMAKMSSFFKKA